MELIVWAIAGGAGGLARAIIDGKGVIPLPQLIDSELRLGVLASIILGAFVGAMVDQSPMTAGLAGYAGIHALESIITRAKEARG